MKIFIKNIYLLFILSFFQTHTKAQIAVELDYNSPQPVNNLIGFNTGFDHRHWIEKETSGGITTLTKNIRKDILEQITKLSKPVLRFPGGVIANFYHLYDADFDCSDLSPCESDFAKGYGLRQNEVSTFNNGFGAVGSEFNFEQNNNNNFSENWIQTFAEMISQYQSTTSEEIEVVYMANVLSHFKFGNQQAQFSGNAPIVNSDEFQKSLQETAHALQYLINLKKVKVTRLELGTELYFNVWSSNNDVNVDRFINLIPIYRNLLDNLGFQDVKIGVPFNHSHSLNPNADNWSRKLADATYHNNMMFDAWVIHDYQRMVDPCNVVFGTCNNCNNWTDDECTLYNGNPNLLNCEPDNHNPTSAELENVFDKKNLRFADDFNGGLANDYQSTLDNLRTLSGKTNSTLWLTEWNEIFDAGCSEWKGINKFFPNTFAHGVNIMEILHSLYEQNSTTNNEFIEVANFHTLSAPNILYPIINARENVSLNATFYPFEMTSQIHKFDLEKIDVSIPSNYSNSELNVHAYSKPQADFTETYLYFSNKTADDIPLSFEVENVPLNISDVKIKYIQAEALHNSINGEYIFKTDNVQVQPINTTFGSTESTPNNIEIPSMSFGYFHLTHDSVVSSSDFSEADDFNIFPNPVSDILFLEYLPADFSSVRIVNTLGQAVYSNLNFEQQIDVSNLSDGVYFLTLSKGDKQIVKRFVKR